MATGLALALLLVDGSGTGMGACCPGAHPARATPTMAIATSDPANLGLPILVLPNAASQRLVTSLCRRRVMSAQGSPSAQGRS
ncbi:MAG TPA: hypothetical protein VIQ78_10220 [Terrimesophilobacter sp.]|uniref:hypothetical protein n=1 Tax=Terrimesophilobacter sp. TaxID=2906435 RepID=UPI002F93AB6C